MKIPKKVKVGGIDYTVLMAPIDGIKHRNTPMADAMGIADPDARVIILEKDRTDQDYVFLHELIHACLDCLDTGSAFKGTQEEKFVRPFSRVLYDALVNAGLIRKQQPKYGSNRPKSSKSRRKRDCNRPKSCSPKSRSRKKKKCRAYGKLRKYGECPEVKRGRT
jgi:hypothetical protein